MVSNYISSPVSVVQSNGKQLHKMKSNTITFAYSVMQSNGKQLHFLSVTQCHAILRKGLVIYYMILHFLSCNPMY